MSKYNNPTSVIREVTINYGTTGSSPYTDLTAVGDVLVLRYSFYVVTAFTSTTNTSTLNIHTDDTTPTDLVSAADGAEANLTVKTQIFPAAVNAPFQLRSGQKIQHTVGGEDQLTGVGKLVIEYVPISKDGRLM